MPSNATILRVNPDRPLRVPFRRLVPEAGMPERAHLGDAGYDLRSVVRVGLAPGARALVRTGISVAIPEGYAGLVLPRSGLALQHGVAPVNAPGLVDSGYRGEIMVPLINYDPQGTDVSDGSLTAKALEEERGTRVLLTSDGGFLERKPVRDGSVGFSW